MVLKTCFKCNKQKPLIDFYKNEKMRDGHFNKCKECAKKDVLLHRKNNIELIRAYDRKRGGSKKRIQTNLERTRKAREKFPNRYKAYSKLNFAIRKGRIVRPKICSVCDKKGRQIEGHHDDYSKPLEVVWMCSACHSALHRDLANVADNRIA